MKARDIMSINPASVTPDAPLAEAARLMKSENVGLIPVVEAIGSHRLVGVITDRDIAVRGVAEGRDGNSTPVEQVMSSDVRSCAPDDSVADIMALMGREQVRRVPIVDERGSLVGIVSQADVVLEARDDKRAEKTIEQISQPHGKHAD
jgi:CBS domain-containing protein